MLIAGVASAAADNVALPTHQAGDLIVIGARNASSTTPPSLPSGYTGFQFGANNITGLRTGFLKAFSTAHTSGTWTNATHIAVTVFRPSIAASATPLNQTSIDNFNRADSLLGASVWATTGIYSATAHAVGVRSNAMSATSTSNSSVISAARYGPDVDFAFDLATAMVAGGNNYFIFVWGRDAQNSDVAGITGYRFGINIVVGTWKIQKGTQIATVDLASVAKAVPAVGDSIWISQRGSTITVYHRLSGQSTWTAVLGPVVDTAVYRAGYVGFSPEVLSAELAAGNNRWDNFRGGTVTGPRLFLDASAAKSAQAFTTTGASFTWPALALTRLDGTSHGVRVAARGGASGLAVPPTNWTNQVYQPTGLNAELLVMHSRLALVADISADAQSITPSTATRSQTIEITEQPSPVPLYEDSIDNFNRADGYLYAGAGALGGARIWNPSYVYYSGAFQQSISSNRMVGPMGVAEINSRPSLGIDCDALIDFVAGSFTNNGTAIYLYVALANAGTPSATGYALRVMAVTGGVDNWAITYISGGSMVGIAFANSVGRLPVGGSIWFAKRGTSLTGYKRDSASSEWLKIVTTADSQFNRAGPVGIGTDYGTDIWDNFRGGPITWPPEYYPNQQTMMT